MNTDLLNYLTSDDTNILYRFQGGNSLPILEGCGIERKRQEKYIYFSKNIEHHKYFIFKRIRQLLLKLDSFSNFNKIPPNVLEQLFMDIVNSNDFKHLESIKVLISQPFVELINTNCLYSKIKSKGLKVVEKVDTRIYDGGYGIAEEWLELLQVLTILTSFNRITTSQIQQMIKLKRQKNIRNNDCISHMLLNSGKITLNHNFFSEFSKYRVMERLENIVDAKLYKEGSLLDKQPSLVIKDAMKNYETTKQRVLTDLEKRYK